VAGVDLDLQVLRAHGDPLVHRDPLDQLEIRGPKLQLALRVQQDHRDQRVLMEILDLLVILDLKDQQVRRDQQDLLEIPVL
jgi:hypothetical protein